MHHRGSGTIVGGCGGRGLGDNIDANGGGGGRSDTGSILNCVDPHYQLRKLGLSLPELLSENGTVASLDGRGGHVPGVAIGVVRGTRWRRFVKVVCRGVMRVAGNAAIGLFDVFEAFGLVEGSLAVSPRQKLHFLRVRAHVLGGEDCREESTLQTRTSDGSTPTGA